MRKIASTTTMPDRRGQYTLEELMRAKRGERPEPEFWTSFDREFKQKQKLLIQRQLVSETGLKSPFATRFYKIGAFTATCGIAAVAVYLGFQTPVSEKITVAQTSSVEIEKPSFSVAVPAKAKTTTPQAAGLQEFATLAQASTPKVVVEAPVLVATAPSASKLSALKTLASLETTIQAGRANKPTPTPAYQFVSSNGLFESELIEHEEVALDGVWDFEQAYLLGKYADPLTGTINTTRANRSINDIQHVSFSQIDDALSNQSNRSSRSIDALNVRF